MIILSIDPGNIESGYALLEADQTEIQRIVLPGKIHNTELRKMMQEMKPPEMLAIEMIGHYGASMAAGATTFETCVWIGRFLETAEHFLSMQENVNIRRIMRREEKINLCGSMKAKDKDIRTALADRFACGQKNYGKGTKANPGFFYGVSDDSWQAVAVGVTAFDIYVKGVKV